MPQGSVGGGHQNDFKPLGTIFEKHPNLKDYPLEFTKGNVTKNTNRNDNECWTAGTPVEWEGDVSKAKTVTEKVGIIDDMLVSRDPKTGEIAEYHPLITFFNEIMAQIMRDGHRDWLSNMEKEKNAIKLWQYLEEKYLKESEKVAANGSPKEIEAI